MSHHTQHAARAILLAATLACGTLTGCSSGPTQTEEATARWNAARAATLAQLATDQLEAGQLAEARETCDAALVVDQTLPAVHLLSARVALEEDDLQGASASLQRCGMLAPADAVAAEMHHLAGTIAGRWEQADEAVRRHRAAVALWPQEPNYLVGLAEALIDAERAPEAEAALMANLHRFQGEASVFDALGQVLSVQGRPADAAEMYRRASVYAPDDTDVRERQALAQLAAGDGAAAARTLRRLLDEVDGRPSLHIALGEAYLSERDAERAEAAFRQATRLDRQSFAAWAGLTKSLLASNDANAAVMAATRAVATAGTGERDNALLLRGFANVQHGNFRGAADDLDDLARAGDTLAADLYALCLLGLGDEASARATLSDHMSQHANVSSERIGE